MCGESESPLVSIRANFLWGILVELLVFVRRIGTRKKPGASMMTSRLLVI